MSFQVRLPEDADQTLILPPSEGGDTEGRPYIMTELYDAITRRRMSLVDLSWEQQRLHESRRWSAMEQLARVDFAKLSESDRNIVWNAGRSEITTKPSADRLERQTDLECRRWLDVNPTVAVIMQACGTWSRYWNEEEAHHETVFNRMSSVLKLEPISDRTFLEFRKVFPDDDMLRTLTIVTFSEILAAVNYGECARMTEDPGLKELFKLVAADEVQHMTYFISFAKALVDTGAYHAKEAFAVGHLFLRSGGELLGSKRDRLEQRETHVNWWDRLEYRDGQYAPEALRKKEQLMFHALKRITGISVDSRQAVEETWMDLVGC